MEARGTGGEYISIDDLQARAKISSAVIDTPKTGRRTQRPAGKQPNLSVLSGKIFLTRSLLYHYHSSTLKRRERSDETIQQSDAGRNQGHSV